RLIDGLTGAKPYRVAPGAGSGALRALYAVGLASADPERCAVVHLGIGSASDGSMHEALNLAALLRANVVFVVAVHPLDGDAPLGKQLATSPNTLAEGFGIPVTEVDGTDADAVFRAVRAAREAGGPHLVEAQLPRHHQEPT
ncbi:MAG: thiamine pyrophosphate-dependent enzyme, partial [Thermoanaerobaculia bacterium]|nr:thiamine pyrophosphate-dependent enzyme [Thermoanaerobaculia bacterium]